MLTLLVWYWVWLFNNLKLFQRYILRLFISEDVEGSDNGDFSWYTKLHGHLWVSFLETILHLLVSNKNLKSVETGCLTKTSFLIISFGETRQLCWWFMLKVSYHKIHYSKFLKLTLSVSYWRILAGFIFSFLLLLLLLLFK